MEEYDRPRLGILWIPVLRDADHVLYLLVYVKLDTPMVFQVLVSKKMTGGGEDVPKEGTG